MHRLQRIGKPAVPCHIPVGRGNTGHMRAVLALAIAVMGHIRAAVNVVIAKGRFGVDVQGVCLEASIPPVGVELGQLLSNFASIQKPIAFHRPVGLLGILCQCIVKGSRVKGLVVRIQAGVNYGNPGTRTGVSFQPRRIGAGHLAGNGHLGRILSADGDHIRAVLGLHHHRLDAVHGGNPVHGSPWDVGRDEIACQSQVPHHIHGLSIQRLALNGGLEAALRSSQALPVVHSRSIGCNALHGVARFQGGGLLQHNGHTYCVCGMVRKRLRTAHLLHRRGRSNGVCIHRFQRQRNPPIAAFQGVGGNCQAGHHNHDQSPCQKPLEHRVLPHIDFPFQLFAIFIQNPNILWQYGICFHINHFFPSCQDKFSDTALQHIHKPAQEMQPDVLCICHSKASLFSPLLLDWV